MSFLLDTNVVSEWVKPQPNPHVVSWLQEVEEERVFLSQRLPESDSAELPATRRRSGCVSL